MLSLRSFHAFFIFASIVLAAGFGVWGLRHDYGLASALSFALGIALIGYLGYVAGKLARAGS